MPVSHRTTPRDEFPGRLLHRIATLILTASAATLSYQPTKQAVSAEAARVPNIVIILADDLGNGDLACYGSDKVATPHLDGMAKEVVKLTSFYVAPVCSPSGLPS